MSTELQQQYEQLQTRYNSAMNGVVRMNTERIELQRKIEHLAGECNRLGAELQAAQQNAQMLGDDFNERARASGREIEKLRRMLKAAGVDPDGNLD